MARAIFNYGHKCACQGETACWVTKPGTHTVLEECTQLILTDEQLETVMMRLDITIENSLYPQEDIPPKLKSYVWFMDDISNGTEKGKYIAIDIPGRQFNLCLVQLEGAKQVNVITKECAFPKELLIGPGEEMFDYVADCLKLFVKKQKLENEELSAGFTFVPLTTQVGINSAILNRFTGDFACKNCIGKDIVKMLQDSINKKHLNITISVFLNETLGALMSAAYKNVNTKVGVFVGATCNACYMEKKINLDSFDQVNNYKVTKTIVDTQWANFGADGTLDFIRTKYDIIYDEASLNPGVGIFEKMISLASLGELVRIIICDLCNKDLLFCGHNTDILKISGRFPTKFISEIEADKAKTYTRCKEILEQNFSIKNPSPIDCQNLRFICECISRRSAQLLAAGLALIINKLRYDNINIGIDGYLYMYHPHYHKYIIEKLDQFADVEIKFGLALAKYGRGRGAAIAAAVAERLKSGK